MHHIYRTSSSRIIFVHRTYVAFSDTLLHKAECVMSQLKVILDR